MGAKLTFNDLLYSELDPSRVNFGASLTAAVSHTSGVPSFSAVIGALCVDTTDGRLYRNWSGNSGSTSWESISPITGGFYGVHQPQIMVNSVVTSTDGTAPVIGDLVGIFGSGTWVNSAANLNITRAGHGAAGSLNATIVSGGAAIGVGYQTLTTTETFNGSTWSNGANFSISRWEHGSCGSQNSNLIIAGGTQANINHPFTATESFNGTAWSLSGNTNISRQLAASMGTAIANITAGSISTNGTTAYSSYETYNGTSWTIGGNLKVLTNGFDGAGSANAAIVSGGQVNSGSNSLTASELFNGSSWYNGANSVIGRYLHVVTGSQNAALATAGQTNNGVTIVSVITAEIYNGSVWSATGNTNVTRNTLAGSGSQNAAIASGGTNASASFFASNEIYNQTIYRKVTAPNYPTSIGTGILSTSTSVILQGCVTNIVYPANTYLVTNRFLNNMVTNNASLSNISIASVQGGAGNLWTYNFTSTVNTLSIVPGMVVIIASSGANPISAANAGTFTISSVVNPTSFTILNPSGVSNNPGTGTANVIASVIPKAVPTPQDIVVGYVDGSGTLTVFRQSKIGFWDRQH